MKRFWDWIKNDAGERILRLEGPIDEDNFWGDSVTPKAFREELESEKGDVTVWICSPGGSCFAAAEIYTMLRDHSGKVTVKIDSIAASAASVVAMAGDEVLMSPTGMLMIHDPMTLAMGNTTDMEKAIVTLNEVKESIINAYQSKSGLSRNKIAKMMSDETWMNAKKAVEMGFADAILFAEKKRPEEDPDRVGPDEDNPDEDDPSGDDHGGDDSDRDDTKEEKYDDKKIKAAWQPYSTRAMDRKILNWLMPAVEDRSETEGCTGAEDTAEKVEPAEAELTAAENGDREAGEIRADSEAVPQGNDSEAVPQGNDSEAAPQGNDSEAAPQGDDSEAAPQGDDSEAAPQGDDSETSSPVDAMPHIGLDGKTEDGAMPYELLIRQLEFLR